MLGPSFSQLHDRQLFVLHASAFSAALINPGTQMRITKNPARLSESRVEIFGSVILTACLRFVRIDHGPRPLVGGGNPQPAGARRRRDRHNRATSGAQLEQGFHLTHRFLDYLLYRRNNFFHNNIQSPRCREGQCMKARRSTRPAVGRVTPCAPSFLLGEAARTE